MKLGNEPAYPHLFELKQNGEIVPIMTADEAISFADACLAEEERTR
ncbi:MAG: hypothetical protein GY928_20755 [Colwellia sp.]|nr:hypothetical protein [Colwellia sp.]